MKIFQWVFVLSSLIILTSCGGTTGGTSGSSSSSGGSSSATKCSTIECFLENMFVKDSAGAAVALVAIKASSGPTSTYTSNPSHSPAITKINSTYINTTTTTVTLSTLYQDSDTTDFNYNFTDPTGCTPAICYSCPRTVSCASFWCARGTVGDGKLAGSVIHTLGYRAEPADSTTTEDMQMDVQPIVGPVDPATGECTDPIDDTTDPSNPAIVDDALVGDPVESTTDIVGPDAPDGINNGGGQTSSSSSGGSSSGSSSSSSSSSSGGGSGSCSSYCYSVNVGCTVTACTNSDGTSTCYVVNGHTVNCGSTFTTACATTAASYCSF